jgi:hypothetical protein
MPPINAVDQPIVGYQQRASISGTGIIWSKHTALVLKSN